MFDNNNEHRRTVKGHKFKPAMSDWSIEVMLNLSSFVTIM